MRRFLAIVMIAILAAGAVCAAVGEALTDVTGDWAMDYFSIPMIFSFDEDGTFAAVIDMDIPLADDGSNGFTGMWAFDGETLTISDDSGQSEETVSFTWDGEKLCGVMEGTEVYMVRAE